MIRAFVKRLGGPKAVAQKMKEIGERVSDDNVSLWGTRNSIPYKYRLPIARIAKHEKIPLRHIPTELRDFFIEIDATA